MITGAPRALVCRWHERVVETVVVRNELCEKQDLVEADNLIEQLLMQSVALKKGFWETIAPGFSISCG